MNAFALRRDGATTVKSSRPPSRLKWWPISIASMTKPNAGLRLAWGVPMQRKQPFYIRRSVFRNPCPLLTLAIIAAALATNAAHAQAPSLKVAPRFDLTATMQPNPQQQDALRFDPRRNSVQVELRQQKSASSGDKLFNDPEPVEGGWKGLARLLDADTQQRTTARRAVLATRAPCRTAAAHTHG